MNKRWLAVPIALGFLATGAYVAYRSTRAEASGVSDVALARQRYSSATNLVELEAVRQSLLGNIALYNAVYIDYLSRYAELTFAQPAPPTDVILDQQGSASAEAVAESSQLPIFVEIFPGVAQAEEYLSNITATQHLVYFQPEGYGWWEGIYAVVLASPAYYAALQAADRLVNPFVDASAGFIANPPGFPYPVRGEILPSYSPLEAAFRDATTYDEWKAAESWAYQAYFRGQITTAELNRLRAIPFPPAPRVGNCYC